MIGQRLYGPYPRDKTPRRIKDREFPGVRLFSDQMDPLVADQFSQAGLPLVNRRQDLGAGFNHELQA